MKKPADDCRCWFCNKTSGEVRKLISNPPGLVQCYICDICIITCVDILSKEEELNGDFLFAIEASLIEKIQSLELLSIEAVRNLTEGRTLKEFLELLRVELDMAQSKLGEIEKTELGQQIQNLEVEVAQQSRDLEKKKAELESLKGRLAKVSKTSDQ